ncbi:unnamed protein product [Schistosoma curassoni]|uniref:Uncharacterized protein n=1 Tax=Schistosoma curassoni TaxID=6186 RepID=A0A183KE11_9TREM|nr:unnamed protein product [Schistosoma curassoni]
MGLIISESSLLFQGSNPNQWMNGIWLYENHSLPKVYFNKSHGEV